MSFSSTFDPNAHANSLPTLTCTTDISSRVVDGSDGKDVALQIIPLEAEGNFFVLFKSGKVKRIDERLQDSTCTVANYERGVKLGYSQMFGSIIALDDKLMCMRREYNGQYLLATMLTQLTDLNASFPVEFSAGEEMIWRCFLSSQDLQRAPEMRKFLRLLNERSAETSRKSDFSAIVICLDAMRLFIELHVLIAADRKRPPQNNDFSTFSYAHLLIERLRLLLRPLRPYSPFDARFSKKYTAESVGDLMHVISSISTDVMNVEAARRLSFYSWPHMDFKNSSPPQMAEAGFFHQPAEGGDDRVLCFSCNVCLISWEPDDDPYQEHERHSVNCKLLTTPLSCTNIPLAATMSSQAPLRWNDQEEKQNDKNSNDSVDRLIIGTMSSKAIWFAFADPLDEKPKITLLHLDKVAQAVHCMYVDISDPFFCHAIGLRNNFPPTHHQILPPFQTLSNVILAAAQQRRVTWSDEPIVLDQHPTLDRVLLVDDRNIMEEEFEEEEDEEERNKILLTPIKRNEDQQEGGEQSPPVALKHCKPQPIPHSPEHLEELVKITAICSSGVSGVDSAKQQNRTSENTAPPLVDSSEAMDFNIELTPGSSQITAVLFVGITVDETKIHASTRNTNEEVNVLNKMNMAAAGVQKIVDNECDIVNSFVVTDEKPSPSRCPFVLVYHLAESIVPGLQQSQSDKHPPKSDVGDHSEHIAEEFMELSSYNEHPNDSSEQDRVDETFDCARETAILLAETKKLQEKTAKLQSELSEFINADPTAKSSSMADEGKQSQIDWNEESVTDMLQGVVSQADELSNCFEASSHQEKDLNKVNILYEQREISTIVMQCFRLPDELDSNRFRIDHIVSTEHSNGYVVLGVNNNCARNADPPTITSAIVVYSRMEVVHMLQETCLRKFHFSSLKIAQILLLPVDYFALYRTRKLTEDEMLKLNGGEELQNNIRIAQSSQQHQQFLGSVVLRFSDGQVVLFDLKSGFSVPIFTPGEDGLFATDIALSASEERCNDLDQVVVLTNKGRILCFDVKQPIPSLTSGERNEKAIIEISKALCVTSTRSSEDELHVFKDLPEEVSSLNCLATSESTFSSLDTLDKLWEFTRLESGIRLKQQNCCNAATNSQWSSLLANEIQVHAPSNWADIAQMRQRRSRRPTISAFPSSSAALFTSDEKRAEPSSQQNSRTFWSFSRVQEPVFHNITTNVGNQSLVFEFAMPPIMPISHIEISLEATGSFSPLLASHAHQVNIGGELRIWLMDACTIAKLSNRISSSSGSFSAAHNKQALLSLLGEKSEIFTEENATLVYGPVSIEQIVSSNTRCRQKNFKLNVSSSTLLMGAARLQLSTDKLQSGWMNQTLPFFIHYKPPAFIDNEAMNLYKTSTGKSLFLRQQQQTRLLERFGILRNCTANAPIITPATVGSPLKRSHPGVGEDANGGKTKVSPPFYYPASRTAASANTKGTPTIFSLRVQFCSAHVADT